MIELELLTWGVNFAVSNALLYAAVKDWQNQQVSNRTFQAGIGGALLFSLFGGLDSIGFTLGMGLIFFISGFLQQVVVGWGEADTAAFGLLGLGMIHLNPFLVLVFYIIGTIGMFIKKAFPFMASYQDPQKVMEILQDMELRVAFIPVIAGSYILAIAIAVNSVV